ncbi:DUF4926 domain-containing protein [Acidithiobacillus ferrooxidans]|nr:DUF4926 domain-containing protein [Acidithiobacillus ferrooxidans]MCR2831045.1 DUF4926 domain-containing protein [Acidithiobacillus ferrooxidans]
MIQELDTVILVKDHSDQGLVKGDMGAVIRVHDGGKAFEVEFVTLAGDTRRVVSMRKCNERETKIYRERLEG